MQRALFCFLALAANDHGELPGQIERILHSGVHALSAGRTMNMGCIACQEYTVGTIVGDLAAIARRAPSLRDAFEAHDGIGLPFFPGKSRGLQDMSP